MTQISPHQFDTKVKINNGIHVYVQPQVIKDIQVIINLTEDEIGMMGLCIKHGPKIFEIYEILLPKQDIASHTCEITEEGLGELAEDIIANRPDEYNNLRAWFHSHHTMGVGPSGQDNNQWAELSENCNDYFIRGICNKKGNMKIDINMINMGYSIEDVPWSIIMPGTEKKEEWEKEFKEKCNEKKYKQTNWWNDADMGYSLYNKKNDVTPYARRLFNEGWRTEEEKETQLVNGNKTMFSSKTIYNEIFELECEDENDQFEADEYYKFNYRTAKDGTLAVTNGRVTEYVSPETFEELRKLEEKG